MRFLLLNGHGIDMHVDGAKLFIRDGRFTTKEEPKQYCFTPQRIDISSIVIYGRSGNISIEAIRWLIKHGIQITIMNWDGKLLTTMLPPESVQVKTKFAQYRAFEDKKLRLQIARQFIDAKFERTHLVLDYLHQRYPDVETDFSSESAKLTKVTTIKELMGVEGVVAVHYWDQIQKVIPDRLEFTSRCVGRTNRPHGAADTVNCMLNYGYSLLEAECLRAINSVGLDAHVGYLHEMAIGKNSLAYDFQELFRFIVDLAVINLIEADRMEKKDFIRTDNYTLRLRSTGARKITDEINGWLNKSVVYQGKESAWDYVIFLKARELAHFLVDKQKHLDLVSPDYEINRMDADEIRKKILSIPYTEWKKRGFSKGTLHYMKKNAEGDQPFTLNKHVMTRLDRWDQPADKCGSTVDGMD
ncbi:CRISPR-associated endonuclease Cas1 [Methanoregula formicica]|uniref:CRISPR-associated endonuclease Cas1 n=1 Tax=Methanoregula formicica (strain DSM 22288 / NBRC 105244 / SMSP) TaxID=593750 RepID=L0HGW7_METFS|nr:CRISPR-associated endonuclease Cas1 [Methanoregula formicica]AGB03031.1 CRISPR-associated endonuclease Cas1 [Methanoregula formicica SMSP]